MLARINPVSVKVTLSPDVWASLNPEKPPISLLMPPAWLAAMITKEGRKPTVISWAAPFPT